jgi:GNAT superfamily N-acetyltransferase
MSAAVTPDVAAPRPRSISIRPIGPLDRDALQQFYAELSNESRHDRFLFLSLGVSRAQARTFCMPDHEHGEGFVAIAADAVRGERIVGHLCLEPDGTATAEMAIAVADAYRHEGIGRRLLDAGVAWAGQERITRLTASAYATNTGIHRLVSGLARPTTVAWAGGGIIEMAIDLQVPRATSSR